MGNLYFQNKFATYRSSNIQERHYQGLYIIPAFQKYLSYQATDQPVFRIGSCSTLSRVASPIIKYHLIITGVNFFAHTNHVLQILQTISKLLIFCLDLNVL